MKLPGFCFWLVSLSGGTISAVMRSGGATFAYMKKTESFVFMRKRGREFCFVKKRERVSKNLRTIISNSLYFFNIFYNLALKVNFKGKANVQWSEREGSGENATTRYYRATERYFDTTKSLVGQGIIALV